MVNQQKELFLVKVVMKRMGKIGDEGKASMERHETDHGTGKVHSNPHDHKIDWSSGSPHLGEPINYPNGEPEFKRYKEKKFMVFS